jgi:hypothetical protein
MPIWVPSFVLNRNRKVTGVSALRQFWFRFEPFPTPTAINLGCGVTAFSREDALALLRERVFGANGSPPLVEVIDDIARTALDPKHVLPNLGKLEQRGVWFPQGYDEPHQ